MSFEITTFWKFVGIKPLASPQNTANLKYNQYSHKKVWYELVQIAFVDGCCVSNNLNFEFILF